MGLHALKIYFLNCSGDSCTGIVDQDIDLTRLFDHFFYQFLGGFGLVEIKRQNFDAGWKAMLFWISTTTKNTKISLGQECGGGFAQARRNARN